MSGNRVASFQGSIARQGGRCDPAGGAQRRALPARNRRPRPLHRTISAAPGHLSANCLARPAGRAAVGRSLARQILVNGNGTGMGKRSGDAAGGNRGRAGTLRYRLRHAPAGAFTATILPLDPPETTFETSPAWPAALAFSASCCGSVVTTIGSLEAIHRRIVEAGDRGMLEHRQHLIKLRPTENLIDLQVPESYCRTMVIVRGSDRSAPLLMSTLPACVLRR